MEYEDFYDLAIYANENWRGGYTERELAINAYIYKTAYDAEGTESAIIKELLARLEEDANVVMCSGEVAYNYEAIEFIRQIKDGK